VPWPIADGLLDLLDGYPKCGLTLPFYGLAMVFLLLLGHPPMTPLSCNAAIWPES
jgi:hypothetical protein